MTELIAKPIVKNQYWVITDGDKKVGNVVADNNGFDVKLNGIDLHFTSTDDIKQKTKIIFESVKNSKATQNYPYPEYPTTNKVYNSVMDIKRKLHLFTKTSKSKCFHVAGWFVINQNGTEQVSFCPKYIFIQRYSYIGPFKSETQANQVLNNT
jgi:hypothetical protein